MLWHWLGFIPHTIVDLVLELQDECFGIDHGPIDPSDLLQFWGGGFFDFIHLFF